MADDYNPWQGSGPATDDEAQRVVQERMRTLVELEGLPIGEQLKALTGHEVESFSAQELAVLQAIGAWYAGACATARAPRPPDVLRAVAACANEVVSFNVARQAAGDEHALGMPTQH